MNSPIFEGDLGPEGIAEVEDSLAVHLAAEAAGYLSYLRWEPAPDPDPVVRAQLILRVIQIDGPNCSKISLQFDGSLVSGTIDPAQFLALETDLYPACAIPPHEQGEITDTLAAAVTNLLAQASLREGLEDLLLSRIPLTEELLVSEIQGTVIPVAWDSLRIAEESSLRVKFTAHDTLAGFDVPGKIELQVNHKIPDGPLKNFIKCLVVLFDYGNVRVENTSFDPVMVQVLAPDRLRELRVHMLRYVQGPPPDVDESGLVLSP